MIAPTAHGCKRVVAGRLRISMRRRIGTSDQAEICRHGIVSRIIILPKFRLSTALLDCEKQILRWPGPFGTGFLSPQPPGVVRIGPVRKKYTPILGQRELVLFLFGLAFRLDFGRLRIGSAKRYVTALRQWHRSVTTDRVAAGARCKQGHRPCELQTGLATQKVSVRSISEATYMPRPASGRACRGCRPGYRPQRHRCPRGRYFPAARSNSRSCRSSRRPSAGYAPHCSR
jgi:hypothetical protein